MMTVTTGQLGAVQPKRWCRTRLPAPPGGGQCRKGHIPWVFSSKDSREEGGRSLGSVAHDLGHSLGAPSPALCMSGGGTRGEARRSAAWNSTELTGVQPWAHHGKGSTATSCLYISTGELGGLTAQKETCWLAKASGAESASPSKFTRSQKEGPPGSSTNETLTLESPPRLLLTSSASTQKALNLRIPLRVTIS